MSWKSKILGALKYVVFWAIISVSFSIIIQTLITIIKRIIQ